MNWWRVFFFTYIKYIILIKLLINVKSLICVTHVKNGMFWSSVKFIRLNIFIWQNNILIISDPVDSIIIIKIHMSLTQLKIYNK